MRLAATWIGMSALLLSGCAMESRTHLQNQKELAALKGPDTGSIATSLKAQAETAENAGDFKRASQVYRQLADKEPDNEVYALALADDYRRAGDNESALKVIDMVLKKNPGDAAALESKGLSLMATGEFTEAGTAFGEVMKTEPKRWRTLNAIGVLFALKNMDTEALAYYKAALAESTDEPHVLNNMALTQAMGHEYDRAIETFQRAERHVQRGSTEMKHIDLNLALVYAISGKLELAEQTAAPHLNKAGLYNNMGFYAYLAKNTELSKSYLNMALTQNPLYYERAWKNLSMVNGENEENPDDTPMGPRVAHAKTGSHAGKKHKAVKEDAEETPQPEAHVSAGEEGKASENAARGEGEKAGKTASEHEGAAAIPQNVPLSATMIPGASDSMIGNKARPSLIVKNPKDVPATSAVETLSTAKPAAGEASSETTPVEPLLGVPLNDIPESKK